jgi:two-component system, OmpR family, sensor histidine kinase SenX3
VTRRWRHRIVPPVSPAQRSDAEAELEALRGQVRSLQASYERATGALAGIHADVVVCDQDGIVVLRNEPGGSELLVEQAVKEALTAALAGVETRKSVEVFGMPRRLLDVAARPIIRNGELLGAAAVIDDISELRRIEQVRRDFVSNISHELRTPVGALCVLAETMAEETDPEVLQRLASRMEVESVRLADMVDDLLTLTMIETDDGGLADPVSPRSVVRDAVGRIAAAAERRGIEVVVADATAGDECFGVGGETLVLGDRRQLISAIFNLLDNAIKYSDRDSTVTVKITLDETPGRVRIDVSDEGIGIPPRDRERIFERFYRVDKARARDTGGTGLGLSIVRHVVHNHGGEVTVSSREGEGSVFSIVLPAAQPIGSNGTLP